MRFPEYIFRQVERRANGRCEKCGMPTGPSNPAQVDHIKEVWEGGAATLDNAQLLGHKCCHRAKSAAATKRRAKADRQRVSALEGKKSKWPALPGCRRSAWKRTFNGWEKR